MDVCASRENAICPKFFSADNSFLTADLRSPHDGSDEGKQTKPVIWCNPPLAKPAPFISKTIEQTRSIPGAVAAILVPDWPGSEAHTLVKGLTVL